MLTNVDKDTTTYSLTGIDPHTEYSFKIRIMADNGYPGLYTEPLIVMGDKSLCNTQDYTELLIVTGGRSLLHNVIV